jgi:predicted RNA-binding protein
MSEIEVHGLKTEIEDTKPSNGDVYKAASLRRKINSADIGSEATALYQILGVDLNRKGNLALIEDDVLIYVAGNAVVFEDVFKYKKEFLLCIDDGGIGCVAVHPSR